ncbi:TetR/AcrR family transcriptional regulator, partial [Romboutsia sp.]|uniref:TetR/AcrR family transcriptional regulator n=1 Tax=Romboutsia sp. TaxID=1965302 RepID=UPI003F390D10
MEYMQYLSMENTSQFCKPTFNNIPNEKRNRILEEAEKEFAQKGFIGANINKISKNAGISIGSMYSYFESKEDLYL